MYGPETVNAVVGANSRLLRSDGAAGVAISQTATPVSVGTNRKSSTIARADTSVAKSGKGSLAGSSCRSDRSTTRRPSPPPTTKAYCPRAASASALIVPTRPATEGANGLEMSSTSKPASPFATRAKFCVNTTSLPETSIWAATDALAGKEMSTTDSLPCPRT